MHSNVGVEQVIYRYVDSTLCIQHTLCMLFASKSALDDINQHLHTASQQLNPSEEYYRISYAYSSQSKATQSPHNASTKV